MAKISVYHESYSSCQEIVSFCELMEIKRTSYAKQPATRLSKHVKQEIS